MLRHYGTTPSSQSQAHNNRTKKALPEKHIFAFIVEVEQVADFDTPVDIPVIALCDSASPNNWVSAQFLQYLESISSTDFKYTKRTGRWKESEVSHIYIRWSCEKLGQFSEEGTFFIEPKAQFKILFGCGYNSIPLSTKIPVNFPSQYRHRRGKRIEEGYPLSEKTAESLRQGIEDRTLLPVRIMPPISKNGNTFKSIADLEVELEYIWRSYSVTEHLLTSDSSCDGNSSRVQSSADQLLDSMGILYSEPDADEHSHSDSTNTAISEEPYGKNSLFQRLRRDQKDEQQASCLRSWMDQSIANDPQPWIPRTIHENRSVFPFNRCPSLTPNQRLALAEARKTTEEASTAYWTWDDKVENYKHYDDGCSEPVWYNPP